MANTERWRAVRHFRPISQKEEWGSRPTKTSVSLWLGRLASTRDPEMLTGHGCWPPHLDSETHCRPC
ncbi:hypothetical protein K1pha_7 [Xanthomonas phage KPhi1]|uniref:Uncharacterized protein n=1 Tax=Xanthomonas phage KPhi1 TaxID=1927017 RepID=A0A3G1GLC5_9CAUD|nr:hypothetical protein KEM13_gp07 [Xanthomonas phage KPhi1]APQ41886.1 hypothetical protein K1pha_7 [Xanthomonas phage KPhi1]